MNEPDRPAESTNADRSQSDRTLGPKAWTAIVAVTLTVCAVTWIVASVLTARPSVDPTVHADAIALAISQQPDPSVPSRYAELVDALMEFHTELDRVEDEVAHERGEPGSGWKMLDFSELLNAPDPSDSRYYEQHVAGAEDARRAAIVILERDLFRDVTTLLKSPNLAREYDNAHDASGNLLPMFEWPFDELSPFRKLAMTVVGCARALAERGDTEGAASLLEDLAPLPVVLTRHITLIDHLVGYAIAALIASEVEHMAIHSDPDRKTLDTLHRIHNRLSDFGNLSIAIEGEDITMRDIHYRTHTAGGRYIPSVTESMFASATIAPTGHPFVTKLKDSWGYLAAPRDSSLTYIYDLHAMMIRASEERDPRERDPLLAHYENEIDTLSWRYDVLQYGAGVLSSIVKSYFDQRARLLALNILLAMAEYRLDHGDWPESIDRLVPDYLDAIPINPVTGAPFEYDYEPGEPPSLERLGV